MNKLFSTLIQGTKPLQSILNLVNQSMADIKIPAKGSFSFGGNLHEIEHVGDAMHVKIHYASFPLTKTLLQKSILLESDRCYFQQAKLLVIYWFAKQWLAPIPDYNNLCVLPEQEDGGWHSQRNSWKLGHKPNNQRLSATENYISFTQSFSGGGRTISFIHGAGNMSSSTSPLDNTMKLISGAGAKVAKSDFELEDAQTDGELDKLYYLGTGLVLFWLFKRWITIVL